jgi:pyruvate formate lyase activating enzyme
MQKAPLIGICRHRLSVDGKGVTTLVAFHGCTLHCRYCLNARCLRPDGVLREVTTGELLDEVSIDNLYFVATNGGVTFGGGEPCLRSLFIKEFAEMMPGEWNIAIETSLNVERHHVERLAEIANQWIVDIKDTNAETYRAYTGRDNRRALDNLKWLLEKPGMAEKITVRLPLIPEYNNADDVKTSRRQLEAIGVTLFDEFQYVIREEPGFSE